jgi:cytochrome b involved in lipid metabolism
MYTMEEVKKHNSPDDAWTVIGGKVYDITSYVMQHPGGRLILAVVGKDSTEMLNRVHIDLKLEEFLSPYLIGIIEDK